MSFNSPPTTATVAQLQAEIALLRLQVRSALMSTQANADTIVHVAKVLDTQAGYIERLDDLWHAHLTAACDLVMAAADDSDPDPCDVLQVDLWHDESITRRIN